MKLGIFSDLHSNLQALESMFTSAVVDLWVCLGDFVGLFPRVNEVVTRLRERRVFCVLGDHERALLEGYGFENSVTATWVIQHQRDVLSNGNRAFLQTLEDNAAISLDGVALYACHDLNQGMGLANSRYLFDLGDLQGRFVGNDVILFGHTHFPLTCYAKETIFINPGSCGFPVDVKKLPSYAVFDSGTREVELKRFDFDRDDLVKDIDRFHYPPKLRNYILGNFVWG